MQADAQMRARHDQFANDLSRWMIARDARMLGQIDSNVPFEERIKVMEEHARRLKSTRQGVRFAAGFLRNVKEEVEKEGTLSGLYRTLLGEILGVVWIHRQPTDDGREITVLDQNEQKRFVELLNKELLKLKSLELEIAASEEADDRASIDSASLPSAEEADKLLRYETHIERQLYRAMDQLERLQKKRNDGTVRLPLNVDLGSRN